MQILIDNKLHNELLATMYDVSIIKNYDGRDSLLVGIPHRETWKRVTNNDIADLTTIIENLKNLFLGDEETVDTWALLQFIDKVHYHAEGTSVAKKLRELRARCINCFELAQKKQSQVISFHEYTTENQVLTFPTVSNELPHSNKISVPETAIQSGNTATPLLNSTSMTQALPLVSSPKVDVPITSTQKDDEPDTTNSNNFFDKATFLVVRANQRFSEAFDKLRLQQPECIYPHDIREIIEALEATLQQFRELVNLLDQTIPLPEEIAPHHQYFGEHVDYLAEQFRLVIAWLSDENIAKREMLARFARIEIDMQAFNLLTKREGSGEDSNV